MPWFYAGKLIRAGKAWTDNNGTKHPYNWMSWTDAQKAKSGLVWKNEPAPFDKRFYWDADTPRELADLKTQYKASTKRDANSFLQPTDWKVIKASEVSDYTVDDTTLKYRAAVRTASNTIESAIDGAKDHAAFVALFVTPVNKDGSPTGNPPIADWPDQI
tara:strand:- start:1086 stop:1565 length:480 start_codon:yes stop_codon:yes gene_type:complete